MLPLNLLALIGLMAWGASAGESASSPSPSPSADVELICHTDNPAECYPKLFQATDEFQIVHPDQDLPLGLHVRLDVTTGLKEAKINVPDEHDPALEGLPVDSSMVVVEQEEAEEQIKLPPNAPAYEAAGKIKEPKIANPDESSAFYKSLTILKKGLDVDNALEMLEDISHDIYYGLKIAEDYDTVHELFCLATAPPSSPQSLTRARLAALTLSSTLQNNPKALAEIETHWPKLGPSVCPSSTTTTTTPLSTSVFTLLPTQEGQDADPSLTKARISLLTTLLKSPHLRTHFLTTSPSSGGGPSEILRILTSPATSSPAWSGTQRRAAQLLTDTFLDADMGAALGEWPAPNQAQLTDAECAALAAAEEAAETQGREEECLDWHVGRLRAQFRGDADHWSHELGRGIGEARKGGKKGGTAESGGWWGARTGGGREKADL
jgi:nucleotide exchange factor SIL1